MQNRYMLRVELDSSSCVEWLNHRQCKLMQVDATLKASQVVVVLVDLVSRTKGPPAGPEASRLTVTESL